MKTDDVETHEERMEAEELLALALLAAAVLFWTIDAIVVAFSGNTVAFLGAVVLATYSVAALLIGWRTQRSVAVFLLIGVAVLIAWGFYSMWDLGIWLLMGITIILEMLADAGLMFAAAEEEEIIEEETDTEHHLPTWGVHAHA